VRHDERTFDLAYRPILDGAALTKLIVIITDVTAGVERERAEQAQRELMSIFRRLLSDSAALDDFFSETTALVRQVTGEAPGDRTVLRRAVHTIKGNTALFGIESVATVCDRLENRLEDAADGTGDTEVLS